MDLLGCVYKYSDWLPDKVPVFHAVISCILSQKIKFTQSRAIRKKLYSQLGSFIITREGLEKINLDQLGIEHPVQLIIKEVMQLQSLDFDLLSQIKGIGPWTIKAVKIMTYSDEEIALYEDGYIIKNLVLYGYKGSIKDFFNQYKQKSLISRFLWRIKPQGIIKIKKGTDLLREDFW